MFRFGRPAQLIGMTWFRTPVAVSLIPGILAFVARLYGLSDKPLSLDEVITHVRANLPISDLIASSLSHTHFPTYFFLAHAFDTPIIDEWMLRLPSVIFGTVAVMLVAMVATEIKTPRATPLYARLLSGHARVVGIGAHRAAVGDHISNFEPSEQRARVLDGLYDRNDWCVKCPADRKSVV